LSNRWLVSRPVELTAYPFSVLEFSEAIAMRKRTFHALGKALFEALDNITEVSPAPHTAFDVDRFV
jgi:hypothetical protein